MDNLLPYLHLSFPYFLIYGSDEGRKSGYSVRKPKDVSRGFPDGQRSERKMENKKRDIGLNRKILRID